MRLSKNSLNFSIHLSDNDFQQSFGCPNWFLPSLVHRGFYEATGVCAELLGGVPGWAQGSRSRSAFPWLPLVIGFDWRLLLSSIHQDPLLSILQK